jgi:hypothetical protein
MVSLTGRKRGVRFRCVILTLVSPSHSRPMPAPSLILLLRRIARWRDANLIPDDIIKKALTRASIAYLTGLLDCLQANACATFNILNQEDRKVAGAILILDAEAGEEEEQAAGAAQ